jgi:aryl-alcohol dehydrogenase-like predicted oxidoreductase
MASTITPPGAPPRQIRRPLRQRRLGRTNLMVSEIALGGYMFTGDFRVPRAEALAILDCAFRAGINYVDTAQMYGYGEGEELVGRALRAETGLSITELGIRYLLADPDIACLIPGAQTVGQLQANMAAAQRGPLPAELMHQIEQIAQR